MHGTWPARRSRPPLPPPTPGSTAPTPGGNDVRRRQDPYGRRQPQGRDEYLCSDRFSLVHDGDVVRLTPNADGTGLETFEHLWYANGRDASEKSPLNWISSKERARLFDS